MTASMKRQPEPLANEIRSSFDALLGDFRQRLVCAGRDGRNGQGEVHDRHRNGLGASRQFPEGVQRASEDAIADAELANILEQDFRQGAGIDQRNVRFAHCTSPRVHSRQQHDTTAARVESFRFRDASAQFEENQKDVAAQAELSSQVVGSQSTTSDAGIYCPCDQAHNVTDQDICGYAKWRRG